MVKLMICLYVVDVFLKLMGRSKANNQDQGSSIWGLVIGGLLTFWFLCSLYNFATLIEEIEHINP